MEYVCMRVCITQTFIRNQGSLLLIPVNLFADTLVYKQNVTFGRSRMFNLLTHAQNTKYILHN